MKRIVILAALLGLASPVRADISDTGDLLIGGQGVVQGTMTISGESFSVGGTTLAVTGGRVGIGVSSPTATLEVNGSIKAASIEISGADVSETSFAAWFVAVGSSSAGSDVEIKDSYNIDHVYQPTSAQYDIFFSTPFANPFYYCACSAQNDTTSTLLVCLPHPTETTTASKISFVTRDLNGGTDRPGYFRIGCAGRLTTP